MYRLLKLTFCMAVVLLAPLVSHAQDDLDPADYVAGEFLIGFVPEVDLVDGVALLEQMTPDAQLREVFPFINSICVEVPEDAYDDAEAFRTLVLLQDDVEYVEPNYVVRGQTNYPTPSTDPLLGDLWFLDDIELDRAWQVHQLNEEVIVAVIDGGVKLDHKDIEDNLWRNENETAGNEHDDDNNGYVDDVHGYDFVNGDGDPSPELNSTRWPKYEVHGSHVSGSVAAVGRNNQGIAGVGWRARIMPLKILDSDNKGTACGAVAAVKYAIEQNVSIINMSFESKIWCEALENALKAAAKADILMVAAAGNGTTNTDSTHYYPACYNVPGIISVAATNEYDNIWGKSNFGKNTVDLGAPGSKVLSTIAGTPSGGGAPIDEYDELSGTSMAAPIVSGTAALVRAHYPGLKAVEVKELLMKTVCKKPYLSGKTVSEGLVNVYKAVTGGPVKDWFADHVSSYPMNIKTQLEQLFNNLSPTDQIRIYLKF